MRRLALILGLLVAVGCVPHPVRAQFIGFTSPQTVQQALATSVACTGTAQLFTVQNLGQNQHFAAVTITGAATQLSMVIQGLDVSGSIYNISDQFISAGITSKGVLYGSGYFPIVRISVTCSPVVVGVFTLSYTGTSANTPQISGNYQTAQQNKFMFSGAAANANQTATFQTPFGNSGGLIRASYAIAAVAASSLTITCSSQFATGGLTQTYTLANATTVQTFKVTPGSCPIATVDYTSGGATAGVFGMEWMFEAPGTANSQVANYFHISATTAASAKGTAGTLTNLLIGTPANGTVTLHDLATAACTATPATEIVAVITAVVTTVPQSYPLNLFFRNGICIKASATMDITAGVQ